MSFVALYVNSGFYYVVQIDPKGQRYTLAHSKIHICTILKYVSPHKHLLYSTYTTPWHNG